ncbi:MAG: lysophospholipid acyltransferase family protein [Anaeromyxobacter sp.]
MYAYAPVAAAGYLVSLLLVLVTLPLQALLLLVTWPFDRNRAVAGRFLRLAAVGMAKTFPPWRLQVEGRFPGKGPYVVVANHESMLDILLISHIPREMKWVAKASLFDVPWVGWMFRLAGDIPVTRGNSESGGAALARARRYLAHGMNVMIFPEGTRSTRGTLLPFKSGAFRLALDAKVPVLPVAVAGTARGLPKGNPWVRPCRATARILEPMAIEPFGDDAVALRDAVRARIEAAVQELRGKAAPVAVSGTATAEREA